MAATLLPLALLGMTGTALARMPADGTPLTTLHPLPPGTTPPRYIRAADQPPIYPVPAVIAHQQGKVLLDVLIGSDGMPLAIVPEFHHGQAPMPEILVAAALRAVSQWRFEPARHGSQAVETWAKVTIQFDLPVPERVEQAVE